VQCPKWPLVITLKGCGLLHKSRRPKRLHKAISSQPTWGGYRTVSVVTKYSIHRNSPSIKFDIFFQQRKYINFVKMPITQLLQQQNVLKTLRMHTILQQKEEE
jgi:hypothetical protein